MDKCKLTITYADGEIRTHKFDTLEKALSFIEASFIDRDDYASKIEIMSL